jgi:alkylation response protein AidB-like acyl-CoA dehydrogenase
MRFSFEPEQLDIQRAFRTFLEAECRPADVRAAWEGDRPEPRKRWLQLAELGVVAVTVPVEQGGLGLDERDLVLLLEESGRALLPEPFLETTAVAVPLLAEIGDDGRPWLSRIATGETIVTVGLEPSRVVPSAHVADVLLLQHGDEVHAVPRRDVRLEEAPSFDRVRTLSRVHWAPRPETRIAGGAESGVALARAFDRGALGSSAELLGVCERAIEMSVEYARAREQFGRPIGSFQAVKHMLADTLVRLAFARPAVYRAVASLAGGSPDTARDVSMAKALASEAAVLCTRTALQVHGAVGYTWEHDLHFWLKRGHALARSWGDARWHRERVAVSVLGPTRV